jgi:hypothetical protein
MTPVSNHTFHIPVMGLAFTIDTPARVARYGISSVVSIVDDILIEGMREYYYGLVGEQYIPITAKEQDFRSRRITDYLNLLNRIVTRQIEELRMAPFEPGNDVTKYFELLPETSPVKALYRTMLTTESPEEKQRLSELLRTHIHPGAIDVNIMTKLDRINFADDAPLPPEFSDALAAARGFALSDLESSLVLSAGMNMRLFSYLEQLPGFYPDASGRLRKKIILKVSDYRSAYVQGKVLAKKGLWVSEYRIESGLNCGGHAFATEGLLLGTILEEFATKREELHRELSGIYNQALAARNITLPETPYSTRVTVQGGVGTAEEHQFLIDRYGVDSVGWGSPFLLVPEATNVDDETRHTLATATIEDYYTSMISPLGVPFNTVRGTSSEQQKLRRIEAGRPGSPCVKKYLVSNTEFTEQPICTASRQYQDLKLRELSQRNLSPETYQKEYRKIVEKDCLCEGLASSALINSKSTTLRRKAVLICPGPNLAYFSGSIPLRAMVGHIYGRENLPLKKDRPHMFINEVRLYVDYLQKLVEQYRETPTAVQKKYISSFAANLRLGIEYYTTLVTTTDGEYIFGSEFCGQLASALQHINNSMEMESILELV